MKTPEQSTLAIIGLGYVGLPLAVEFGATNLSRDSCHQNYQCRSVCNGYHYGLKTAALSY